MNDDFYYRNRDDRYEEKPTPNPAAIGRARIRVVGVGGAGNNAVNNMIESGITSAEYVAVNTDAQALACSKAKTKIQIGTRLTSGLGAGADPEIGRNAAEESKEQLTEAIKDTDLLFITAGMGGGTGTGAAPVIAKIAKDLKILTVAFVTEPFPYEGQYRMDNALKGIENIRKFVDSIVIIPNRKIDEIASKDNSFRDLSFKEAFGISDEVLKQGIRGIADLIVTPALVNLDFADVRTVLKDKGLAHMGTGVGQGENRIVEAVRYAVNSPLIETTIEGATGVIVNIVGGNDLTYNEVKAAGELIQGVVDRSANIIFGAGVDESITDRVEVTVIATGFPSAKQPITEESVQGKTASPSPFNPEASRARSYEQPRNLYDQPRNAAEQPRNPYEQQPRYTQQPAQPQYDARLQPQQQSVGGQYGAQYAGQYPVEGQYAAPVAQNAPQAEQPVAPKEEEKAQEPSPRDQHLPLFVQKLLKK